MTFNIDSDSYWKTSFVWYYVRVKARFRLGIFNTKLSLTIVHLLLFALETSPRKYIGINISVNVPATDYPAVNKVTVKVHLSSLN